jgi:hypothetical protein
LVQHLTLERVVQILAAAAAERRGQDQEQMARLVVLELLLSVTLWHKEIKWHTQQKW